MDRNRFVENIIAGEWIDHCKVTDESVFLEFQMGGYVEITVQNGKLKFDTGTDNEIDGDDTPYVLEEELNYEPTEIDGILECYE